MDLQPKPGKCERGTFILDCTSQHHAAGAVRTQRGSAPAVAGVGEEREGFLRHQSANSSLCPRTRFR